MLRHALCFPAGHGVLQSYTTKADTGKLEKWIALMMPRHPYESEEDEWLDGWAPACMTDGGCLANALGCTASETSAQFII